jgi:hypothetical protein
MPGSCDPGGSVVVGRRRYQYVRSTLRELQPSDYVSPVAAFRVNIGTRVRSSHSPGGQAGRIRFPVLAYCTYRHGV